MDKLISDRYFYIGVKLCQFVLCRVDLIVSDVFGLVNNLSLQI